MSNPFDAVEFAPVDQTAVDCVAFRLAERVHAGDYRTDSELRAECRVSANRLGVPFDCLWLAIHAQHRYWFDYVS
jgi:hypothetical protein